MKNEVCHLPHSGKSATSKTRQNQKSMNLGFSQQQSLEETCLLPASTIHQEQCTKFCTKGLYSTSNIVQHKTNILAKSHFLCGFKPKEVVKQLKLKEAEALSKEKYMLLK